MKSSSFSSRVYEIVAQIPPGKVITYGQIAWMLGRPRAARAVGYAMSQAPENRALPCHRVVNRTGTLAPEQAFLGERHQRFLLELEGVHFLKDERIDMESHCLSGAEVAALFPLI